MPYSLVYVGASWCGSCKTIKPTAIDLCMKYGVAFQELDLDEMEEEEKMEISKVPTLTILKGESKVVSWNVKQVESLKNWLSENISLNTDDF